MKKYLLLFLVLGIGLSALSGSMSGGAGFDAQNLSLWTFTAKKGLLPYRVIFYPYGILSYYQASNTLIRLIYLLIPGVNLFLIFMALKSSTKRNLLSLTITLIFSLFVYKITGFETFTRYGGVLALGLYSASLLFDLRNGLIVGLLSGLQLSAFTDQGIYALLIIAVVWFVNMVDSGSIRERLNWLIKFLVGYVFGLIPFVLFILFTGTFSAFADFINYLRDVATFAKTPFTPYALSADNVFTFILLFSSVIWLSYLWIYRRSKLGKTDLMLLSVTTLLILLEQKSFIRSMDRQLTFISFIGYFLLILSLGLRARPIFRPFLLLPTVLTLLFAFIFTRPIVLGSAGVFPGHELVISQLKKKIDFNGRVFSYPGDPVFYQITNQNPPFFFTIYEATPKYAQERQIRYISENKICYIIRNMDNLAIQDGVPNEVRSFYLIAHILSNFEPEEQIGSFLIYKHKLGCQP